MKTKHITVTLTESEARNLIEAAHIAFNEAERGRPIFDHKSHRDAAHRAHDKIQVALSGDRLLT